MKIFKTCFLITKRRALSLLLYFFIFAVIAVITTATNQNNAGVDFTACRPKVTVLNFDRETPFTEGFLTFLSQKARLVDLPGSGREAMQDAVFFHATDYIIRIPEGFSDRMDSQKLEVLPSPGSFSSYYAKILVNRYWNAVTGLRSLLGDASEKEVASQALKSLSSSASVNTESFGAPSPFPSIYLSYGYILAYILMAHLLLCISNVQISFKAPAIQMRNLASPRKPWQRRLPLILYSLCLALISWGFFSLLGLVIYRPFQDGGDVRLFFLGCLNTLSYALVAASLALLASSFLKNHTAQSIVCNLFSLGFCFLGGVFVPQAALSEDLLLFSRFTPTYWYVLVWDEIFAAPDLTAQTLSPIFSHLLLELGFAAALFLASLAVEKTLNGNRENFGEGMTRYLG